MNYDRVKEYLVLCCFFYYRYLYISLFFILLFLTFDFHSSLQIFILHFRLSFLAFDSFIPHVLILHFYSIIPASSH